MANVFEVKKDKLERNIETSNKNFKLFKTKIQQIKIVLSAFIFDHENGTCLNHDIMSYQQSRLCLLGGV